MVLRFPGLDFEIGPDGARRAGRPVPLSPLAERLLLYLVDNRDRIVPSDELLREVWKDVSVTPASLHRAIRQLRREIAPDGLVRTVRGRGYQLACPVEDLRAARDPHRLPWVGRDALLARLLATLERVRSGRGRILLVSGPAGIGKTRLLHELADRARRRGFQVWRGASPQDEAEIPLLIWEQVLRGARADPGSMEALSEPERRAIGSTFASLGSEPDAWAVLAADDARARLFEAVHALLVEASRRRPLVVSIDDLHRSDPMSLRLLEWIAPRVSALPLLLIAAHRPVGSGTTFGGVLERLVATRDAAQEPVEALSYAALSEALRLLRGTPAAADEVEDLWRRSGGNPLFVRALLLSRESGPGGTPSSIHAAVAAHLASLSADARETLREASVLGLVVERALALGATGATPEAWDAHFAEAQALGLVGREGDGAWSFSHGLVWEALRSELAAERRTSIHAQAARLLASRQPDDPTRLAALADHAVRGVPTIPAAEAARRCVEAAEEAVGRLAFEEADRLLRLALDHTTADDARLALLLAIADNRARLADVDGVLAIRTETLALAEGLGDGRAHARATLALIAARGDNSTEVPDADTIALIEQALAAHDEPTSDRARLLTRLGEFIWYAPPRTRGQTAVREAIELARRCGDPDAYADALVHGFRILQTGVGDDPVRAEIHDELEGVVDRVTESVLRLKSLQTLVWDSIIRGDAAGVGRWVLRMEEEARATGSPQTRWWSLVGRVSRAHLRGEFRAAEELAQEGHALGRSIGFSMTEPNFALQMLAIRWDQGRLGEIEDLLGRCQAARPGFLPWEICWRHAGLLNGRPGPARELLRAVCHEGSRWPPPDLAQIDTLTMLADSSECLGDRESARILYESLRPASARHPVVAQGFCHRGSVAHYLGKLCATFDDGDGAVRWYEAGLERDRALGALPFVARGQIGLGHVLVGRGGTARERGLRLIDEGSGLAHDLGMQTAPA